MRYFLAISSDENAEHNLNPDERAKMFKAYGDYTESLRAANVLVQGDPLLPSAQGARVRIRTGKRTVVDGPFTEAKEVFGGYYILQCKSLQEATEWAARCPGASHGTLEVRPIMEMSELKK
jgi:hypothetical protein